MTAHRPITLPPNATPIAIADQPAPMLEWVEIARMVIDDSYQRPIMVNGWKTIRKIAENFSWSCFTAVQIAPTQDGRFAVIDKAHDLAKAEHKSPSATARQAIALMIRQHGTAVAA